MGFRSQYFTVSGCKPDIFAKDGRDSPLASLRAFSSSPVISHPSCGERKTQDTRSQVNETVQHHNA